MNDKHNNLMLQENGYPHRICGPDYSDEPVLTLNEAGMPVLETQAGCTGPADYSFACINNYVHAEDPQYEDLQNLALGMATHIEKLERQTAYVNDEIKCEAAVREKLSFILAGVAIALKGEELPLHRHSYHDLVEKTQVAMLEIELLKVQRADASKDSARLHWILPIITGNEDDMTNAKTVALSYVLMVGLDGIAAVDAAMIKDQA